jgi:uncharacterized protein
MSVMSPPATQGGPADPTPGAISVLRPLHREAVRLDPAGLLGAWQERNAASTLPHCLARVEESGSVENLRRVVGEAGGTFRGMWFADSDVYKVLEAVAWELGRRPPQPPDPLAEPGPGPGRGDGIGTDPAGALEAVADLLARAQEKDGYLNSYFQTGHREKQWRELRWSHELYCAGHLIQAAVAAARVGAGETLLPLAQRFANLLVARFGAGGTDGVCGHPEIETALVELYRLTGHAPYLRLAARFVELRGHGLLGDDAMGRQYYQDHLPVRRATEVTGHAVRQLYLLAGVVDVAVETGDRELLAAAERLWESAFGSKTYLTGGHGSRHRDEAFGDPYELPPDRAYAETCAAIGSFQWNWRLLLATGDGRYADEMERVLYNGIAVATSLDGRNFFYSNPLQLRTGHDGTTEDASSRRRPWYSCSCCPPNLARLMASLHAYVATGHGGGVQLHLYAPAEIDTPEVRLRVETGYPWDGRIAVTVRQAPATPWTLALRVPAWCPGFTVDIDGEPVAARPENGYLRLTRAFPPGTTLRLALRMPARLVGAHPRVDAVRGCAALARGPLVYCLEQADLPAGAVLEDVLLEAGRPVEVVTAGGPSAIPVTLAAPASLCPVPAQRLYPEHSLGTGGVGTPVTVAAVPYFLWGNRAPGAMRVWIPVAPAAPVPPVPAAQSAQPAEPARPVPPAHTVPPAQPVGEAVTGDGTGP